MSLGDIVFQAPGRSLTSNIADVNTNIPKYEGLLDNAPSMPPVGSDGHQSLYMVMMVKFFYEWMRLIGALTPEQNKRVDEATGDDQTLEKFIQVTGRDIDDS